MRELTVVEARTSFVVESTLAGRGLTRHVDRMNEAGYTTRIAFVFLDSADLCVRRMQERVRKGGAPRAGGGRPSSVPAEQGELLDVVPSEGGSMDPLS